MIIHILIDYIDPESPTIAGAFSSYAGAVAEALKRGANPDKWEQSGFSWFGDALDGVQFENETNLHKWLILPVPVQGLQSSQDFTVRAEIMELVQKLMEKHDQLWRESAKR